MNTIRLMDAELQYEITGTGEPALLISTGPIADSFLPLTSQPPLAGNYRLITYHQRRPSATADAAGPVSFAQHAADAAALLHQLGIRRAHVAGHSTGAAIALQLAVDHPALVHTLALLEPPLVRVPTAAAFFEKAGPALAAYAAGDHEGAMVRFLSTVCSLGWETCRAEIDKHVPGGAMRALRDADNFFGSYLPALNSWQFGAGQAAAIEQPVLSVLGTDSDPWFVDGHQLLHTWFSQIEDCVVDGVAHLLHMQRPEPVARCIAAFFARHPIDTSQQGRQDTVRIDGAEV